MKKVTIEIDDKYGDVISVTAIGVRAGETTVSGYTFNLEKGTYLSVDSNAHWEQRENA